MGTTSLRTLHTQPLRCWDPSSRTRSCLSPPHTHLQTGRTQGFQAAVFRILTDWQQLYLHQKEMISPKEITPPRPRSNHVCYQNVWHRAVRVLTGNHSEMHHPGNTYTELHVITSIVSPGSRLAVRLTVPSQPVFLLYGQPLSCHEVRQACGNLVSPQDTEGARM